MDLSPFPWLRRLAEAWSDHSPAENASPEVEDEGPRLDGLYSRSTDLVLFGQSLDVYTQQITANPDSILRREGSQDLELFDALLDDDVAMSNLQTRRLAITSKDWEVSPGDPKDPRSVKAADDFRAMLKDLDFDRVTAFLHYGVWYGYAVGEALWTTKVHDGRRIVWLDDIVVPDRRWFGFTLTGELRFVAALASISGEELPPNKFFTFRTGGTHDFAFYGLGLAHWAYWPVWFKRAALKCWALYLEKMAQPTAVGEQGDGWSGEEKGSFLKALMDIGRVSAVRVPKGTLEQIKLMESTRSGAGAASYTDYVTEQNEALMRIVLGQPGTSKATPQGVGGKQAEVHQDVAASIVKGDADGISGAIKPVARWVTRWNYGPDVAPPTVYRVLEDVDDVDTIADRDVKLDGIGIRRTDESIGEVYGDGYERKPEPTPAELAKLAAAGGAGQPPPAANDAQPPGKRGRRSASMAFDAHDPAPLYVHRDLKNAAEVRKWAEGQGLKLVADPHVTVLYSRTPVDWFAMGGNDWGPPNGELTVPAGGPRKVERLGEDGKAIVLQFLSSEIKWRHEGMVERGASHDFPSYEPHVTITTEAEGETIDVAAIEPYAGPLVFGPELFEELESNDDRDPASYLFEAVELDAIDRMAARLAEDSNPVFAAMATELQKSLEGVTTLEGARVALLQAFESLDWTQLARLTALPLLAERAAAESGVEERVRA